MALHCLLEQVVFLGNLARQSHHQQRASRSPSANASGGHSESILAYFTFELSLPPPRDILRAF